MKDFSQIISFSLPVLYLIVIYVYYQIFSEKNKSLVNKTTPILLVLVVCHLIEIITRNIALNTMPLSTTHDSYAFIAFSILLVYMISELGLKNRGAGLFILFFALVLQLLSTFNMSWEPETSELLANKTFAIHASLSITGYTALSLAAIYALMYIIQNNNLKKRKLGNLFLQLPALTYLEKMSLRSVVTGIILLGIGILLGHYQALVMIGDFWPKDIKVILSDAVWILYVAGFIITTIKRWRGEKMAYMSLYGFLILIVGGGIIIYMSESFHKFN
ncbi:MAG: cytochrome c biogenesis protein CcsA [Cyclobacteriaceae bacterium]|nr:cytochrome c biogenesis protein CcsA [Cyclobacteriaceae bacterium]